MSEPSFSVSGKPLKSTPQTVTNGEPFWPDLDLAELQGHARFRLIYPTTRRPWRCLPQWPR